MRQCVVACWVRVVFVPSFDPCSRTSFGRFPLLIFEVRLNVAALGAEHCYKALGTGWGGGSYYSRIMVVVIVCTGRCCASSVAASAPALAAFPFVLATLIRSSGVGSGSFVLGRFGAKWCCVCSVSLISIPSPVPGRGPSVRPGRAPPAVAVEVGGCASDSVAGSSSGGLWPVGIMCGFFVVW